MLVSGICLVFLRIHKRNSKESTMTLGEKLAMGALAGAGLAWGTRAWLRSRRRITLENRVVVITGASTGHGLMVARYAAEHGARLVLAARDSETLSAAEAELQELGARDVIAVPTDITDRDQCAWLVQCAVERHGGVDILVNNAGIIQVGPRDTMMLEDFETAMATNFWGAVHCTLEVLPIMKRQRFGRIANVVSVGGKVAVPHLLPYTASKFALTGFTKGLRAELAKENILVTGIYPGTMRTGGHAHAFIKGEEAPEYTLFALGDIVPGLSISAERVAAALWRAVCDGDAEVNIGWQSQLSPRIDALIPNWSAEGLALIDRMLPRAAGPDQAVRGEDIPGKIPSLLSRAIPPAGRPRTAG
jgi:NAD(P)-dependent dehydrogenase (short-subunit alcohol dehydrogenase family)